VSAPAGHPTSFTFVSANDGWVLDEPYCAPLATCTSALWTTHDAGRSWRSSPLPSSMASNQSRSLVRFANLNDGYVFGPALWSTHDGGVTWSAASIPRVRTTDDSAPHVDQLEISGRVATATVQTGDGDARYAVITSPTDHDAWNVAFRIPTSSAAPVDDSHLSVHGANAFVVVNARLVAGNARFVGGTWRTWTTPCDKLGGPAVVTTSSANGVVVLCVDGVYFGTPGVSLYVSTDAGATFTPTPTAPPGTAGSCLTSPTPSTMMFFGSTGWVATFDGGKSWQRIDLPGTTGSCVDIGFTTTTQGMAVVGLGEESTAHVVVTRDGGHTWSTVPIG
jgi:hypothetical protein